MARASCRCARARDPLEAEGGRAAPGPGDGRQLEEVPAEDELDAPEGFLVAPDAP